MYRSHLRLEYAKNPSVPATTTETGRSAMQVEATEVSGYVGLGCDSCLRECGPNAAGDVEKECHPIVPLFGRRYPSDEDGYGPDEGATERAQGLVLLGSGLPTEFCYLCDFDLNGQPVVPQPRRYSCRWCQRPVCGSWLCYTECAVCDVVICVICFAGHGVRSRHPAKLYPPSAGAPSNQTRVPGPPLPSRPRLLVDGCGSCYAGMPLGPPVIETFLTLSSPGNSELPDDEGRYDAALRSLFSEMAAPSSGSIEAASKRL